MECPKALAAQLEETATEWIGNHGVRFDIKLVKQLDRREKREIDYDGELMAILDGYLFHNRPVGKKASPTATRARDRKKLEIRGGFESLSPAQREVFWRVVKGSKNAEIASQLGISINTVKTHRAAVRPSNGAGVDGIVDGDHGWRSGREPSTGHRRGRPPPHGRNCQRRTRCP